MGTEAPQTLLEALRARDASSPRGFTFISRAGDTTSLSWHALWFAARRRAHALTEVAGLRRGDRAVLVLPDPEPFVRTFVGATVAGVAPVPMPSRAPFRDRKSTRLNSSHYS